MWWMTSRPAFVLVVGWLAVTIVVGGASRLVVRRAIPEGERDNVPGIAGPLMPALGATFAVLAGITLASEAGYLRDAHSTVSTEAAAASRLAWAATSPGVDTEPIHDALAVYLRDTRAAEWGDSPARGGSAATAAALGELERVVRAEATRTELGTPSATELLASVDALAAGRRARLADAARHIPALYAFTLVVGGLALVANAGALAFRSGLRASLLIVGLASLVGLSLALLFALTGPWQGALVVSGEPIDAVVDDLDRGFFQGP